MTGSGASRRAFLLMELMMILGLGVVLLSVMGKLLVDMIHVQHIAALHADRVSVMDELTRRLRDDALAATECHFSDNTLTLRTIGADGQANLTYTVEDAVVRRAEGSIVHEWRARRLGFSARIEQGPHGGVFWLDFIEQPPSRAVGLPHRTFSVSLCLPAARPAAAPAKEGQP